MACFLQNKPKRAKEGVLDSCCVDDRRWNSFVSERELPRSSKRFAADDADFVVRAERFALSQCIEVRPNESPNHKGKAIFRSPLMRKIEQTSAEKSTREPRLAGQIYSRFEPLRRESIRPACGDRAGEDCLLLRSMN